MSDFLVEILYMIASALLLPVLLVLVAFMAGTLLTLGGLAREAVERRRAMAAWRRFLADLRSGAGRARGVLRLAAVPATSSVFAARPPGCVRTRWA